MKTNICIVGVGAVGSVVGGRLATLQECRVSVISRSSQIDSIEITSDSWGTFTFHPTETLQEGQRPELEFDFVVVTTKALPDVFDVTKMVEPLISKQTAIVLIQNGIGIEDPFVAAFPHSPIVSTVAYIAASRYSPTSVKQTGFHYFNMGMHTKLGNASLDQFLALGRKAGLDLRGPFEDIQLYRWHKLLWNCAFNPLSILCGEIDCQKLLNNPDSLSLLKQIMSEVQQAAFVVLKKPFPKDLDSPEKLLEITRNIKDYKPSMLLDWIHGRPLEIEVILGNTIRTARDCGFEMEGLDMIYRLLKCRTVTNVA